MFIVVGDVHGRTAMLDAARPFVEDGIPVIFLGDYLDSYVYTVDKQMQCFIQVIEWAESCFNVTALKGNHEASYLDGPTCAGWKGYTQTLVNAFGHYRSGNALKNHVFIENFLLTHAGISNKFLGNDTVDWVLHDKASWNAIGKARSGAYNYGGPRWCDWEEEFEPLPGLPQIVGHSSNKGKIQQKGNSYNVDGLVVKFVGSKPEVLYVGDKNA